MAINSIQKNVGITLATSTNNQVATVTGANALTGESNLTFNGSTLTVTGDLAVTGNVTKTGIPLFIAENSTDRTNVSGDGTNYTVVIDSEITDQGADFNTSTYTFTAPVTGTYLLRASVAFANRSSGHWSTGVYIVTSNRTYRKYDEHLSGSTFVAMTLNVAIADMDASDTAYVLIYCQSGTKTVTVTGNGPDTSFSGYLIG